MTFPSGTAPMRAGWTTRFPDRVIWNLTQTKGSTSRAIGGAVLHPDSGTLDRGEGAWNGCENASGNDGLFRKHRILVHGITRNGAEALTDESGVDLGTDGDDFSDCLVSEAGGQVHLFHVEAVIVHAFGPVKAHCFDLELNFTWTGLALGQIFNTKDFGTTKLVESDGFRHDADVSSVWISNAKWKLGAFCAKFAPNFTGFLTLPSECWIGRGL